MPQNTFILQGQYYVLESLEEELDAAFVELYTALLGSGTCDWDRFKSLAHEFFLCHGEAGDHDKFFNNFTILWINYIQSDQLESADNIWKSACSTAWSLESEHPSCKIHKGTPYYFWGMTALLRGDIDRGYALMHQALEEDCRKSAPNSVEGTPALALVTLNDRYVNQAARDWVKQKANIANDFLTIYQQQRHGSLSWFNFSAKFLQNEELRDQVVSFSYVLGRLVKINETPNNVMKSDFTALLYMDLMLRILQVIEASLKKANSKNQITSVSNPTLFPLLKGLGEKAGFASSDVQQALQSANNQKKNNFDATLSRLLNESAATNSNTSNSKLYNDLCIALICRNYWAHELKPSSTISSGARQIQESIFCVLFLLVEKLY